MLHNEARELLVQGYEATHDAKGIAKAYSVSKWTVYRLAEQKRKTGSVALRTSQRGRKPVLTAEDKENIQHCMDESPDITIEEIREKLLVHPVRKRTRGRSGIFAWQGGGRRRADARQGRQRNHAEIPPGIWFVFWPDVPLGLFYERGDCQNILFCSVSTI